MTDRTRARLLVTGLVQGVGFRTATRREALRLRLDGWVRNLPDGSVEAVFEGPKGDVEAAAAWCRRGPPGARVDDLRIEWQIPAGERGFGIGS